MRQVYHVCVYDPYACDIHAGRCWEGGQRAYVSDQGNMKMTQEETRDFKEPKGGGED